MGYTAGVEMTVLIYIGIGLVICGILSGVVADSKGRDGGPWFLIGLFFGPLGLIAAAGLSDKRLLNAIISGELLKPGQLRIDTNQLSPDDSKTIAALRKNECPYCGKPVKHDQSTCHNCGRYLGHLWSSATDSALHPIRS